MKPFPSEVASAVVKPLTGDLRRDIPRITSLIKRRLGPCRIASVRAIVEEVLPYHLWCAFSGIRGEDESTVEYAALALGEDIREAIKKSPKVCRP